MVPPKSVAAFLEPMSRYINELGWGLYSFDQECGRGQHEFDFGEVIDPPSADVTAHVIEMLARRGHADDPRVLRKLDALMDRDSEMPFDKLVARDLARALMSTLLKNEATVIALYYQEGLTMKEIGRVMGISESRVCQIHSNVMSRLKGLLGQKQGSLLT